ncbi:MAG: ABC transporter permease [candidate division Zixibacteria bacterium]|nr:ABC transporter permease [candidate division Zixibacteria bacterium]
MDLGLTLLGRRGVRFITALGGICILFAQFLYSLKDIPRSGKQILQQLYVIGVRSLPLVIVISIFVGAVSAWQAAYQFKFIGAPLRLLGSAVGKAVVIELAPVLSALVVGGRVGAGIAAELGTMRVTEQIDALDAMGISPMRYLVMPRVLACLVMMPLLVVFANFIAIMGGLAVSVIGVDVSTETFMNGFKNSFQISDFINGLTKAMVFGLLIGLVGCHEGFHARGGAEGVGHATTSAVVISCVLILVFNFIFAVILFRL